MLQIRGVTSKCVKSGRGHSSTSPGVNVGRASIASRFLLAVRWKSEGSRHAVFCAETKKKIGGVRCGRETLYYVRTGPESMRGWFGRKKKRSK